LDIVRFADADLTVIALGLVLLFVLVAKGVSRKGTWLEGGWPSGHVAVAFAAATIVGYVTWNAAVLALCYFIAFLVAQSRVEAEIHTVWQSVVGALLGVLLVTLVFQVFFR
jgi:diacylglycerol kinase (ATP)